MKIKIIICHKYNLRLNYKFHSHVLEYISNQSKEDRTKKQPKKKKMMSWS